MNEAEKTPHPLDALRAYVAQCAARAHDERLRYESEADAVLNTAEQCLALATEALAAVERERDEARAACDERHAHLDAIATALLGARQTYAPHLLADRVRDLRDQAEADRAALARLVAAVRYDSADLGSCVLTDSAANSAQGRAPAGGGK